METDLDAPVERVFDLCLDVGSHVASMARSRERAVGGRTDGTRMTDTVTFVAPFGPAGRIAERLVLGRRLRTLIVERNRYLQQAATR